MQFLYRVRPTRPGMLVDGPDEREARSITAHAAYLERLVAEGVVLMAGRTLNTDETSFGIVVFVADSEEAAAALMNADPAIRDGVMSAQLFPYRIALWSTRGPDNPRASGS